MRRPPVALARVFALLTLLTAAGASFLAFRGGLPTPLGDEFDILRPSVDHMRGVIRAEVKYPSFPFLFYGAWLSLTGTLDDLSDALVVARAVNAALLGVATLLFYALGRRFMRPSFAFITTLMFLFTPNTLTSANLVKTEALLFVETLVVLLAAEHIAREPRDVAAHAWAGVAAALGVTTKLSIYPLAIYGATWLYAWRAAKAPTWRATVIFVAMFCLTVALTGDNLVLLPEMVDYWQDDHYFQPNASPMRAVPSLGAFPYDRYGSFFYVTLPLALGWPLYLLASGSVFTRVHRGWYGWAFGGATLLTLLVTLNATLLRIPHSFAVLFLWPVLSAGIFVERVWDERAGAAPSTQEAGSRTARVLRRSALVVTLTSVFGYGAWVMHGATSSYQDLLLARYIQDPDAALFVQSRTRVPDRETIRTQVAQRHPATLVVLNSYFMNMCRYRDNAIYADNCAYFDELMAGSAGYRVVDSMPLPNPARSAQLSAEVRLARFYVLRRIDEAADVP